MDQVSRWWAKFLKDSGGTGFWHEAYFKNGGFDAVYDDMAKPTGLARIAIPLPARGPMFSTRHRVLGTAPMSASVLDESTLYADKTSLT